MMKYGFVFNLMVFCVLLLSPVVASDGEAPITLGRHKVKVPQLPLNKVAEPYIVPGSATDAPLIVQIEPPKAAVITPPIHHESSSPVLSSLTVQARDSKPGLSPPPSPLQTSRPVTPRPLNEQIECAVKADRYFPSLLPRLGELPQVDRRTLSVGGQMVHDFLKALDRHQKPSRPIKTFEFFQTVMNSSDSPGYLRERAKEQIFLMLEKKQVTEQETKTGPDFYQDILLNCEGVKPRTRINAGWKWLEMRPANELPKTVAQAYQRLISVCEHAKEASKGDIREFTENYHRAVYAFTHYAKEHSLSLLSTKSRLREIADSVYLEQDEKRWVRIWLADDCVEACGLSFCYGIFCCLWCPQCKP